MGIMKFLTQKVMTTLWALPLIINIEAAFLRHTSSHGYNHSPKNSRSYEVSIETPTAGMVCGGALIAKVRLNSTFLSMRYSYVFSFSPRILF